MKKFLAAILAAFLLCVFAPFNDSFAENRSTAQTAQNIIVGGVGPVVPYVLSFDTTGSDLTVVTPGTGKMACVIGAYATETSATNITFKSGTTTLVVPELAANSPLLLPIGHTLLCTQPGEALNIQVSAAVSSMLLYVVQAKQLNLSPRF